MAHSTLQDSDGHGEYAVEEPVDRPMVPSTSDNAYRH